MKTMKAAEVVLDFDLYPRNNVDTHNVRCIMEAMLAGVEMPPVIIDRKSKRCADGFHRVKAALKIDANADITAIEKTYRTEADLFIDAMRYNASHGARLDPCDRTRCLLIAEKLSIPIDAVAGALHVQADRLGELRATRTATTGGGLEIPLKRTISHMAGRRLTKQQAEVNSRSSGMNQTFYANQIIDLIESKLLNLEDEKLMERLKRLHELLEELLVAA